MKPGVHKGRWTLFFGLLLLIPGLSSAQPFPTRPMNLIVSWGPGLAAEMATRLIAGKAEKFLGQPFVITNNGAGGGSVAATAIAREKPDGYHMVGLASSVLVRVPQFRTVPYKLEDFTPIMHFATVQTGLVVSYRKGG